MRSLLAILFSLVVLILVFFMLWQVPRSVRACGKLLVDKCGTAVISGEDPPVVGLSTVYELTIIVRNIGGSNVSDIKVNETISSDVVFVSLGTPSQGFIIALPPPRIEWDVGTLTSGANATLTFRVETTPTSLGSVYLNHKEDIVASGTDTISGTPVSDRGDHDTTVVPIVRDVAAMSQIPSTSVVNQGDNASIDVVVKNFGNISETFNVTCYYDGNAIDVIRVCSLASGNQTTISFSWSTASIPPRTYSITTEADSSYEINESNEINNICVSPSIIKVVVHDVAILSQTPSPMIVKQGEIVTIEVVVENEGTESESFTVSCYYNETLLETKAVADLIRAKNVTLSFLWNTTDALIGTYFINTTVSVVPGESDVGDNICKSATSVTVTIPHTYQITFDQFGVGPDFVGSVLVVDGVNYGLAELPISFLWDAESIHVFAFQSPLVITPKTKRFIWIDTTGLSTLKDDSLIVSASGNVTGYYNTQYYLTVLSPYGLPNGEGWYDSSVTVYAGLDTSLVEHGNQTRRVFYSWSGDASGINYVESDLILMDNAKTAIANWNTQYYLIVRTEPSGITSIAGEGWFYQSSTTSLLAPVLASYDFLYWDIDGDPQQTGVKGIFVIIDEPRIATAHYKYLEKPIIVGGHSISIRSVLLCTWTSLNVVLFAVILAAASLAKLYKKRRSR